MEIIRAGLRKRHFLSWHKSGVIGALHYCMSRLETLQRIHGYLYQTLHRRRALDSVHHRSWCTVFVCIHGSIRTNFDLDMSSWLQCCQKRRLLFLEGS